MIEVNDHIPDSVALLIAGEATRYVDATLPHDERLEQVHVYGEAARAAYLNKAHAATDGQPVHVIAAGYDYGTRLRREDPLSGENIMAEYAGGA